MPIDHDGSFRVPQNPEVPRAVHQAVLEQTLADRRAEVTKLGTLADEMERIGQLHRARMEEAIGADAYQQIRAARDEEKRAQQSRQQAPSLEEMGPEALDTLQQERRVRSEQLLQSLGVDRETLRAASKETHSLIEGLIPRATPNGHRETLVTPEQVPEDIRSGRAEAWTWFRPPYAGWDWSRYWSLRGPWVPSGPHYIDQGTGYVGSSNNMANSDAGDDDEGYQGWNASVGFWHYLRSAGQVEVWIKGRSTASHHHINLYDEFGVSSASVYQNNFLTMKVTAPNASHLSLAETSRFWVRGWTDGHWDEHYLCNGCEYWKYLRSDIGYPADTWVYILVGTSTLNHCFANDVRVYSTVDFGWFLPEVAVGSTGG